MRNLLGLLAAGALVLAGSTAGAAPVTTNASLGLQIQNVGTVSITGNGTVNATGTTVSVPGGLVSLGAPVAIPVTGTTAIFQLTATKISNQSGTFSLGGITNQLSGEVCAGSPSVGSACNVGGGVGGAMGLTGAVKVWLTPLGYVIIPINLNNALVGQGGATTLGQFVFDAAGWTTGVGKVGATANNAPVVASLTGNSSPLTLVTPTFVSALGNLLPLFTTFTLDSVDVSVVPEPGTVLLLGSGVAGLALAGRRRRK